MNKNHIGQSFDSFLKSEGIEIKEEEIKKTLDLMFDKLCAKVEESEDEK